MEPAKVFVTPGRRLQLLKPIGSGSGSVYFAAFAVITDPNRKARELRRKGAQRKAALVETNPHLGLPKVDIILQANYS
jgi:hypothetical protein